MPPRHQHHQPRGIRGLRSARILNRLWTYPVVLSLLLYSAHLLLPGDHKRIAEARERRLHREQEKTEHTRWRELRSVEQDQEKAAEEENKRWR